MTTGAPPTVPEPLPDPNSVAARAVQLRQPGSSPGDDVGGARPEVDPGTRHRAIVIRDSWRAIVGLLAILAGVGLVRVAIGPAPLGDLVVVGLVGCLAAAIVVNRRAVEAREADRRAEVEHFARILQGLARAVSPDAVLKAIVDQLGSATGADHVVVIRRRPDAWLLDATLVSMRPGVPTSTTTLPANELDEPWAVDSAARVAVGPGIPAVGASVRPGRPGPTPTPAGDAEPEPPSGARLGRPARFPAGGASGAAAATVRLEARARDLFGLTHTMGVPLLAGARVVGAIIVNRRTSERWPDSARRLLAVAADEASTALGRVYSLRAAEARATTDALTGLPNRGYFEEYCALLSRRRRTGDRVGILMIDIDLFKKLNDRHGHATGDRVLQLVARSIAATIRDDDVPARYGGEEFVVLLRNPTRAAAMDVAERVRRAVADLDLSSLKVDRISVSVGVGVAETADEEVRELVEHADRALYRAKREGRDRVEVW